jgi:hypothetical protein
MEVFTSKKCEQERTWIRELIHNEQGILFPDPYIATVWRPSLLQIATPIVNEKAMVSEIALSGFDRDELTGKQTAKIHFPGDTEKGGRSVSFNAFFQRAY